MRRNRQFRPDLDTLAARILPSDMLQYINAIKTYPAMEELPPVVTPTLVDSLNRYNVYYPGAGYAIDDTTACTLRTPASPTVTPTATSPTSPPATPPANPQPASSGR